METLPTIDPGEFIETVQPLLVRNDLPSLMELLRSRWSNGQMVSLLASPNTDARKVAALALGLVGGVDALDALCRALKDSDPMAHEMAEHAMWSIWFRLGGEEANHFLARGAMALEKRDFACALKLLTRAATLSPDFAEAYNQRAIVHYLQESFEESLADCRRTVERMPCHFGAWAGMGHCYAHLDNVCEALKSYERAMSINPGLYGIAAAVRQLRCHL